ncbi:gamma-crystallin N [Oenanthe melanoleuca]|uniref:gamma-crystallin N n=1 Tax=Oenanthe melanoleuca TaxID=2939378 RepID=UPI0024C1C03A|nr:gamma-crystallin N [Oenanthe melanoleuca]
MAEPRVPQQEEGGRAPPAAGSLPGALGHRARFEPALQNENLQLGRGRTARAALGGRSRDAQGAAGKSEDHLPKIKSPDSAGPVTGGSAYEAGKRKAPGSRGFVKKPSRHQPRPGPPPAAPIYLGPQSLSILRVEGVDEDNRASRRGVSGDPTFGSRDGEGVAEGAAFRELNFLFEHSHWKYVDSHLLGPGVWPCPCSSPQALSPPFPQITFYEGKCFTGRKLDVCGSCNSFQDQGFLNRVNSICVQSGAWVCFDHPDFRGQQYILEHGEYPDFYRWNGRSDHLGSCRPIGMHGEHYRIEIFEGSHFRGPSLELTEDCSFLQGQGWDKTCINALKVYGDGAWVLYEEPNYRGRMYVVERGEFSNFNEWQARSASVQSIRRVVNYF